MYPNLEYEKFVRRIPMRVIAKELDISMGAARNKFLGTTEWKLSEAEKLLDIFQGCTWEYLFSRVATYRAS